MLLLLGCTWFLSLEVASAFNQKLPSLSKITRQRLLRSHSHPSSTVLGVIPGKRKFKRLRKKLSRTRRGYRNEGDFVTEENEVGPTLTLPSTSTSATTPKPKETVGEEREILHVIGINNDGVDTTRTRIGRRIRAIRQADEKTRYSDRIQAIHEANKKNHYPSNLKSLKTMRGKRIKEKEPVVVRTVDELRHAVLDQQLSLSDTKIIERDAMTDTRSTSSAATSSDSSPLMDHAVRNLMKERYMSRSTPGNRLSSDNSTLAIAIEGGGMRGCVSAGMVAAITALGLSDTIDTIYGSSAGSVVGAYMVSRQVCMDVYVDILPASKKLFVCKKRMIKNLASLGLGRMISTTNKTIKRTKKKIRVEESLRPSLTERLSNTQPGMNISFVLDGILGEDDGLRPLDIDVFKENGKHQKLRVVSSCVDPHNGKLYSKCFGNDDFFDGENAIIRADREREGLYACLQASMTVPGATGPPINLLRKSSTNATSSIKESPITSFDAFCFEPIPYRSAVEEGATHVVVLATRPEDYIPPTKQGIYETGIAPLYFNSHGQSKVSEFFAKGGQQYLYAEDLMLLEEAKHQNEEGGVLVPPPEILYGVERTKDISLNVQNREQNWNRAHLFPLRVPKGHKELPCLEQDKDAVLEAVRDGFMTAFDSLSDLVGLEGFKGKDVAELVFPNTPDEESSEASLPKSKPAAPKLTKREKEILGTQLRVPGEYIPYYVSTSPTHCDDSSSEDESFQGSKQRRRRRWLPRRIQQRGGGLFGRGSHKECDQELNNIDQETEKVQDQKHNICLDEEEFSASILLESLPGFQDGRFGHLAKGLREQQHLQQQP